jgi:hypothetical protein
MAIAGSHIPQDVTHKMPNGSSKIIQSPQHTRRRLICAAFDIAADHPVAPGSQAASIQPMAKTSSF